MFKHAKSLKHHKKSHENVGREKSCDVCGKRFGSVENMKVSCDTRFFSINTMCIKSFKQKHKDIHTSLNSELVHNCEICSSSFKKYTALRWHMQSEHHCENDGTSKCDICGKIYPTEVRS
jgi:C2H2-type zinc finger